MSYLFGSEKFGELLFIHASQTFRPTAATEAGWRGLKMRRICFEFGIHVFELVRFFFGEEPVHVHAHMPNPIPGKASEVVNIISLEFEDGRAAAIVLNRLSKGPEHYLDMTLDGQHASIHTSIGGEVRLELGVHTKERRPFAGFHFIKGGKAVLQDGTRSRTIATEGLNTFASATATNLAEFIDAR